MRRGSTKKVKQPGEEIWLQVIMHVTGNILHTADTMIISTSDWCCSV